MGKSCLVISPFLPRADDAGHRKRTYESCQLLADLGYELTLLHLAFEGNWYWRKQSVDYEELLGCGVTRYLEFYADGFVGRRPLNGAQVHLLDEWWDPQFEAYLRNHLRRNFYDVVIIHNVWLSKAFDFFPHFTTKLIETHDLFSERSSQFEKIGAASDFYSCSESDEIFGFNRSHVAIAIKADDAKWIESRAQKVNVVTVSPRPTMLAERKQTNYQNSDKVVFGFIGSAHLFNVHCLSAFLQLLKTELLRNPIALEVVLAGNVCDKIIGDDFPFVKKLGYVKSVEDFYSSVDFIFSPLDYGTGLKLKVAEAIEYGVPILSTEHSAEGITIDKELVSADKQSLVSAVTHIALNRPPYSKYIEKMRASKLGVSVSYKNSKDCLSEVLLNKSKHFVLDYQELELSPDSPLFAVGISTVRLLSGQGRVTLLTEKSTAPRMLKNIGTMPANVELLLATVTESEQGVITFDVIDENNNSFISNSVFISSRKNVRFHPAKVEFFDERLGSDLNSSERSSAPMIRNLKDGLGVSLPLFSNALSWDPAILRPSRSNLSQHFSLLLNMNEVRAVFLEKYMKLFHSNVNLLSYSSETELIERLPSWISKRKIGTKVLVTGWSTALQICALEYLKYFGYQILLFKGFKNLNIDSEFYSPPIKSFHDDEPYLVKQSLAIINRN